MTVTTTELAAMRQYVEEILGETLDPVKWVGL